MMRTEWPDRAKKRAADKPEMPAPTTRKEDFADFAEAIDDGSVLACERPVVREMGSVSQSVFIGLLREPVLRSASLSVLKYASYRLP